MSAETELEIKRIKLDDIPEKGLVFNTQGENAEEWVKHCARSSMENFPDVGMDWSSVKLKASVSKQGSHIEVSGHLAFNAQVQCSRCLERFNQPIKADLNLYLLPRVDPTSPEFDEDEIELNSQDLDVVYYPEEGLNLNEMFREQILLSLPMNFICNETCRGLCARCGINQNHETCACETQRVDPRFEVLKQLKLKH